MKKLLLILGLIFSISSYSQSNNNAEIKASISGKSGGVISKDELLATETIALLGNEEKVTSFTMLIACRGKDPREISNKENNKLTKDIKDLIRDTNSGCKVYFENIKVGSRLTKALIFIIK